MAAALESHPWAQGPVTSLGWGDEGEKPLSAPLFAPGCFCRVLVQPGGFGYSQVGLTELCLGLADAAGLEPDLLHQAEQGDQSLVGSGSVFPRAEAAVQSPAFSASHPTSSTLPSSPASLMVLTPTLQFEVSELCTDSTPPKIRSVRVPAVPRLPLPPTLTQLLPPHPWLGQHRVPPHPALVAQGRAQAQGW